MVDDFEVIVMPQAADAVMFGAANVLGRLKLKKPEGKRNLAASKKKSYIVDEILGHYTTTDGQRFYLTTYVGSEDIATYQPECDFMTRGWITNSVLIQYADVHGLVL